MKNPISLTFATLLLAVSSLSAATRYVSMVSAHPTPPYTNWATAATNIQDAVDAAAASDKVVVTNGVYKPAHFFISVQVNRPMTLLSINGPQFTVIDGGSQAPCVSLARLSLLEGAQLRKSLKIRFWLSKVCSHFPALLSP
jgi:hypothetical protein